MKYIETYLGDFIKADEIFYLYSYEVYDNKFGINVLLPGNNSHLIAKYLNEKNCNDELQKIKKFLVDKNEIYYYVKKENEDEINMNESKIEIGDVVQLKSGGPFMTVYYLYDHSDYIDCKWFEDYKLYEGKKFHKSQLRKKDKI
jgi:uncharacterized protein YodC (DUF2158 family)